MDEDMSRYQWPRETSIPTSQFSREFESEMFQEADRLCRARQLDVVCYECFFVAGTQGV